MVDLTVYGNHAYVAHHLDRWDPETDAIISILDISDPSRPTELNRIGGPSALSYQAVYADSDYVYTAEDYPYTAGAQIRAFQKSDSENYVCWNTLDYSKVVEMWSQSEYWLIVDSDLSDETGNGLYIYKPAPTGTYDYCESVNSYEVTGVVTAAAYDYQYAYIGTADGSLWILDISDPSFPSLKSKKLINSNPIDAIAAVTDFVYLTQGTTIKIISTADPELPVEVKSLTSPVVVTQLGADDGYLYITSDNGMYVYDVRDSSTPLQAGYYLDYNDEGFGSALYLAMT